MCDEFFVVLVGRDMEIEYASDGLFEALKLDRSFIGEYKCHELLCLRECTDGKCKFAGEHAKDGILFSEKRNEGKENAFILDKSIELPDGRVVEILRNSGDKNKSYRKLKHDFCNQLQILTSMMNLDTSKIEDFESKRLMKKAIMRMKTVSMIYEYQYEAEGEVFFKTGNFLKDLMNHHAYEYEAETSSKPVDISSEIKIGNECKMHSTSLLLLFNEIISYAYDLLYECPRVVYTPLFLNFRENEYGYEIELSFVPSIEGAESKDEGPNQKTIIELLTYQLGGNLSWCFQNGTEMLAKIPLNQR